MISQMLNELKQRKIVNSIIALKKKNFRAKDEISMSEHHFE